MLASFLTGLTDDSRFNMNDHDCGFDFVAMLPARTAPASPLDDTGLEKLVGGQLNWMGWPVQTIALEKE